MAENIIPLNSVLFKMNITNLLTYIIEKIKEIENRGMEVIYKKLEKN